MPMSYNNTDTLLVKKPGVATESACEVWRLLATLQVVRAFELLPRGGSLTLIQLKHLGIAPFIKG